MIDGSPRVAVLGAGSWGTALAVSICGNECPVRLWARDEQAARELSLTRTNARYLPGHRIPDNLAVTADLAEAVDGASIVVVAVPSDAVGELGALLSKLLTEDVRVVSASKGLDSVSGRRVSQVLEAEVPQCAARLAALSGPNLAVELAAGVPTAGVIASADSETGQFCRRVLASSQFRLYTTSDIIGVELGGSLKNVMAIAAGICEGMGFGDNTKAALLTRGLAEMTRLGLALGARAETFAGLSGVGDLIATAASRLSRNLRVGLALGQGRALDEILQELGQVAEGVPTTRAVVDLARRVGVDMPISSETHSILFKGLPPSEGLAHLMERAWKDE